MKFLAVILVGYSFLYSGCASVMRDLDISKNKEKYEKELPYREGDEVTLTVRGPEYSRGQGRADIVPTSRYGLAGNLDIEITNLKTSEAYSEYLRAEVGQSRVFQPVEITAKVVQVGRDCGMPKDENGEKCSGYFYDKFEYIDLGPETKKLLADWSSANAKENAELQAKANVERKRCQPFFNRFIAIRKKLEGMSPEVANKAIESGVSDKSYLQADKNGKVSVQNDFEKHFNKSTEREQRELVSLVNDKKYYGCPGSVVESENDFGKYRLEDPRGADLSK